MSNLWDAEFTLSPKTAVLLIEQQFPALAPVSLTLLGEGWDNFAFRVNVQYVFRFPRRQMAVALLETERKVLPLLAPSLPLPIPVPLFCGEPTPAFPFPFNGYSYLPGKTACQYQWSDAERAQNAVPLAHFLTALHEIPLNEALRLSLPLDTIERTNLKMRAGKAEERLLRNANSLATIEVPEICRLLHELAYTPPHTGPLCCVHGDLYARQMLANAARRICGVIDWGDVHAGDPALDLSIAFSFLPPSARNAFRDAYGPIDEQTWRRAQFRALHYGAVLVDYGLSISDTALFAAGQFALHAAQNE